MKVKNISGGTYRLQNIYVWPAGETLDVPEEIAAHVLEAQAERFEVVSDDPDETVDSPAAEAKPHRHHFRNDDNCRCGATRVLDESLDRMQRDGVDRS